MRFSLPRFLTSAIRGNRRHKGGVDAWLRLMEQGWVADVKPTRKPRAAPEKLQEVRTFGHNPGNLRMLEYVPQKLPAGAPLVVVLHGCLQNAADFDRAAGWTQLARTGGFAVLYPEQKSVNNRNRCFNWFRPSVASRDRGEVSSIRQMIESMRRRHRLSLDRVYVFGLSAGGAMAAALMAAYPDVVTGGAIVGGLPFGAARDAMGALSVMKSGAIRDSTAWGDLVRRNAPDDVTRWPTVSIWHGRDDRVVAPGNADALVAQWLDVHALTPEPTQEGFIKNREVRRWLGTDGEIIVEQHMISAMDHGLPVSASRLARLSEKGFYLAVGVCTATEMARAWRLIPR